MYAKCAWWEWRAVAKGWTADSKAHADKRNGDNCERRNACEAMHYSVHVGGQRTQRDTHGTCVARSLVCRVGTGEVDHITCARFDVMRFHAQRLPPWAGPMGPSTVAADPEGPAPTRWFP